MQTCAQQLLALADLKGTFTHATSMHVKGTLLTEDILPHRPTKPRTRSQAVPVIQQCCLGRAVSRNSGFIFGCLVLEPRCGMAVALVKEIDKFRRIRVK